MKTIEVAAEITKQDVALCAEAMGSVNLSPVEIGGKSYASGSIQFFTFAGARDKADGLYKGVCRFLPVVDSRVIEFAEFADFAMLPCFRNKNEPAPSIEEEDDGI